MSKSFLRRFIVSCLCIAIIVFVVVSCGEDEPAPEPQAPLISSFEPTSGLPGRQVVIWGGNFAKGTVRNSVKFGGVEAFVVAATDHYLTATVPAGAVTGKIEVTANGKSTQSSVDFVVPPVITGFNPDIGFAESNITITGTGFSATAANNVVKIGEVIATVTAASATSLTIQAPLAGYSGVISVEIGSVSVATTAVFKYYPGITSFDPTSGPANATITITGSGFDKQVTGNIVKIDDLSTQVISCTANQLVIQGDPATKTGFITVVSGGFLATSTAPYTVIE